MEAQVAHKVRDLGVIVRESICWRRKHSLFIRILLSILSGQIMMRALLFL